MKTTLLLDDEVHRQAKQASARLGIPLTRFIEEAIRLRISTRCSTAGRTRSQVADPQVEGWFATRG